MCTHTQCTETGSPFSVCKAYLHVSLHKPVREGGSHPELQMWKWAQERSGDLLEGKPLVSGKAGPVVQGSHWLQALTEWQRHITGSEGLGRPKDTGVRTDRASWIGLLRAAGLSRKDGA